MAVCKTRDFPGRTTNTTSYIEDIHTALQANACCKVVFMTGDGLVEGLVGCEAAEVEGLAPGFFVETCCKIVVTRGGLVEAKFVS